MSVFKKMRAGLNLVNKVKAALKESPLPIRGDSVLVAISGGADSVALLQALLLLKEELYLKLGLAHLNHGLRGKESNAEERFVRQLARDHGLPLVVKRLKKEELKTTKGLSLEEAARQARYKFLEQASRQLGAQWIALGHTADDQAETVLMRLLRGTGPSGLQGMLPRREAKFIRPLLEVTRAEVEAFLAEGGWSFCQDSSNRDLRFLRNRIRWKLLPQLAQEYNPAIKERLVSLASITREENIFMQQALEEELPTILLPQGKEGVMFARGPFLKLPKALQLRALRWALERIKGDLRGITFRHLRQALSTAEGSPSGRRIALPQEMEVISRYQEVIVRRRGPEVKVKGFSYPVKWEGPNRLPELGLEVTCRIKARSQVDIAWAGPQLALLDAAKLAKPLELRSIRPGDRFCPLGGKGSKKLQDFLVDAKVPRERRGEIPLLVAGSKIAWVVGLRISEEFKIDEATERVLEIRVRPTMRLRR